jgi:adenine-specific DNA-methyltransferase
MIRKQRLELNWIGKDEQHRLEPRVLLEDTDKSYHARQRVSDKDVFDNRLIFGDNLLALKALEDDFWNNSSASILTLLLTLNKHLNITTTA